MANQQISDSFIASGTASTAGGTLSKYIIVRSTAADTFGLCTSSTGNATGRAVGILQNNPGSGEEASVLMFGGGGKAKVQADASISIGDKLTTSTDGQAETAATAEEWCWGIANTATTAAGELVEAWLIGPSEYSST